MVVQEEKQMLKNAIKKIQYITNNVLQISTGFGALKRSFIPCVAFNAWFRFKEKKEINTFLQIQAKHQFSSFLQETVYQNELETSKLSWLLGFQILGDISSHFLQTLHVSGHIALM